MKTTTDEMNNITYYHYDGLGRNTEQWVPFSDEENILYTYKAFAQATYYYDAFGNLKEQTGTFNNNITYAGYQYDKETGYYYLNARYYDPIIARFLSEDTVTGNLNDPLSLNLYTYCHNEPLMYSDPSGHFPLWALIGTDIDTAVAVGVAASHNISSSVSPY